LGGARRVSRAGSVSGNGREDVATENGWSSLVGGAPVRALPYQDRQGAVLGRAAPSGLGARQRSTWPQRDPDGARCAPCHAPALLRVLLERPMGGDARALAHPACPLWRHRIARVRPVRAVHSARLAEAPHPGGDRGGIPGPPTEGAT